MLIYSIIIAPLVASALSLFARKQSAFLNVLVKTASLIELAASSGVIFHVYSKGTLEATPYLAVDPLGAILVMIVSVVGFAASWYSTGYLDREVNKGIIGLSRVKQYFVLLHLFLAAMFFAIMTTNPILMWIAIEATTLSTAFLISFYNKPSAMEAAWKYLIINSVGLLLAFFGTLLFLYPAFSLGHGGLINWNTLIASAPQFDPFLAKIAFIFVLVGYGTKAGLAPMHTWLPDAHSKAPVPISALLSGVLLNVAFLAVLRYKAVADLAIGSVFSQNLLIFFGILSVMIAALIIFVQKNYKRLLAYSSIEHMGIVALGFGFGGAGIFAAMLHMVYHSLAKSILFLSAGNIFLKYSSTKIANVRGALAALPVTGALFIMGFLAITGVPPFGTFLTEFTILSAGMVGHPAISVLALIALILVFMGFLKDVVAMFFGNTNPDIQIGEAGIWTVVPIIVLMAIMVIISFVVPTFMISLIHSASLAY